MIVFWTGISCHEKSTLSFIYDAYNNSPSFRLFVFPQTFDLTNLAPRIRPRSMDTVDEESPPLLVNEIHANGGNNYSNNPNNHHITNGSIKELNKVPLGVTALSNARGSVASAPRAYRPRLVSKDGDCLIQPIHLPHHYRNMYRLAIRFVRALFFFPCCIRFV